MDYDKHLFAIWGPPGGGKTTLAANLAVVLADSGYMTCLVSASDHGELQAFLRARPFRRARVSTQPIAADVTSVRL